MAEVLVEHDYIAKEPNELSITKGDIIKDVVKKQDGWWEGTLKDKKGLFPDNFVKVVDKGASVVLRNKKDAARIRQCRVIFSYKQDHEDELNLSVGDVIDILGEEEEGWWRGLLHGKEGVFPSNFVEEIANVFSKTKSGSKENVADIGGTNDVAPILPTKAHVQDEDLQAKILCEVKFAYKAQNEDELTLKEGDHIILISKDGQDPGWWRGELDGVVGVFPDNFVTILPALAEDKGGVKEEIKAKTHAEPTPLKPSAITAQRKSQEIPSNEKSDSDGPVSKTTPPVPSKKPLIPLKKSPSGSSSSGGGIFYGLKKKIVDVVDGATGSKSMAAPKTEPSSGEGASDNAFDDVVRRPLLSDVRASRPKAPGRRLPTAAVFKEPESDQMNGSTDHTVIENLNAPISNPSSSPELDTTDNKPKLREWEKHKAPWLEEMKLNQAKRTSTSPGPETKLRLTPTEKNVTDADELKVTINATVKVPTPAEKEPSPTDTPKSIPPYKTSPSELDRKSAPAAKPLPIVEVDKTTVIRNKPNVPMPARPQTIHNMNSSTVIDSTVQKTSGIPLHPKISPLHNKTPSPMQKSVTGSEQKAPTAELTDSISQKQYVELLERVNRLEEFVKKREQQHSEAIQELKSKLRIETELRMELQIKVESLMTHRYSVQHL